MFRSAKPEAMPATNATQPSFQILARRPMQVLANDMRNETAARSADPLRETLPWPLPESVQQQLASFGSIRETDAWVQ
jgi:hypothetical protein